MSTKVNSVRTFIGETAVQRSVEIVARIRRGELRRDPRLSRFYSWAKYLTAKKLSRVSQAPLS